ncbi:MAG: DUF4843 domain-containing protein [Odoribacter sp.]
MTKIMKPLFYILSLTLLLLAACSEEQITSYNDEHFVYFVTNEEAEEVADSTNVSFFFYSEDDIRYPLVVGLTGQPFEKDTKFRVEVDKEKTDLPKNLYDLPETFTFAANQVQDTVYVSLKNNAILQNKRYTLKIDIVDYEGIRTHRGKNGQRTLKVSDIAEKPDWWVENPIEWNYLGIYSRKKYELFLQVTGVGNLKGMDLGKVRILTLEFQHWLDSQNPKILDEDGNEMKTEIIG